MTSPEALQIAVQHHRSGRLADAEALYHQLLAADPSSAVVLNLLAVVGFDRGQCPVALEFARRAVAQAPLEAHFHCTLGFILNGLNQPAEALEVCRRALHLQPDCAPAYFGMAKALTLQGHFDEAISAYQNALRLKADYADAANNLGLLWKQRGDFDAALTTYQRVLQIDPNHLAAHNNLGEAFWELGRLDEAADCYRQVIAMNPAHSGAHSNLIFTLHFHPRCDARMIFEEQQRWNRKFSDSLKPVLQTHPNERNPGRRLRIGYVSPDFRDHTVGRFLLPLLERHDAERFEIFCYSGVTRSDWMTERLRTARGEGGGWRDTVGVPDADLAETIRQDAVDILVDLTLHTRGNRLTVFARQPAPIQVAWLGYPGSTGLRSIGYRLTDACMDPPGSRSRGTSWSAEEPIRLPDGWCCYQPAEESPEINAAPALSTNALTFGSLNSLSKVNEDVLERWASLLNAVEGSRLLMSCPEGRARERIRAFFGTRGISAQRVDFVGFLPRWEYLKLYQKIDIALDPFPYNGMTTTCDALWMGVPVLTIPGEMPASRAGLSLLSNIGLEELVARSAAHCLQIAVELASDLPRLAALRATLRPRMQASPLMDAPRFARNVEAAYRAIWERWLAGENPGKDKS